MTVIINPIVQQQTIAINSFGLGLNGLHNGATDSLIELKYLFEGYTSSGIVGSFQRGDLCVFEEELLSSNPYNTVLKKANTNNLSNAEKNLFVFISYQDNNLILLHKGYLDFVDTESESLESWEVGSSLYLNKDKIAINSPQSSGNWVKSIGFCIPNIENKKRIWFEQDSTYFTIV